MKPLDLTKPLQTRLGQKAELVYDGISGDWPLAVVVHYKHGGGKTLRTYTREGILYQDSDSLSNLENVPEKRTFWLNVYESQQTAHPSRRLADRYAGDARLACVEVTYTEGEGL